MSQTRRALTGMSPVAGRQTLRNVGVWSRLDDNPLATAVGCAKALVDFANWQMSRATFAEKTSPEAEFYWLTTGRSLKPRDPRLPPGIRCRPPRFAETVRLQTAVRDGLSQIADARDMRLIFHEVNRRAYRISLEAIPPRRGISPAAAITPEWSVQWRPGFPENPKEIVYWALGEALTVAKLMGRCDGCARFFIRSKQQRQRFCSGKCSVRWHNRERQDNGYFRSRRHRAGDKR